MADVWAVSVWVVVNSCYDHLVQAFVGHALISVGTGLWGPTDSG